MDLMGYCHHLLAESYQATSLNKSLVLEVAHLLEPQKLYRDKIISLNENITKLEKEIKRRETKNTAFGGR